MADIMNDPEIERQVETFSLVPSDGGRFEFSVNGNLIYSKLKTGRHTDVKELNKVLEKHLGK